MFRVSYLACVAAAFTAGCADRTVELAPSDGEVEFRKKSKPEKLAAIARDNKGIGLAISQDVSQKLLRGEITFDMAGTAATIATTELLSRCQTYAYGLSDSDPEVRAAAADMRRSDLGRDVVATTMAIRAIAMPPPTDSICKDHETISCWCRKQAEIAACELGGPTYDDWVVKLNTASGRDKVVDYLKTNGNSTSFHNVRFVLGGKEDVQPVSYTYRADDPLSFYQR
jgi:hypothetical protein